MGSVGNFWKNLNGNNTERESVEVQPDNVVDNTIEHTTTTDDEIDALINSLEQARLAETQEVVDNKQENEKAATFNTDLFKNIATEKNDVADDISAQIDNIHDEDEQAVQNIEKESQVDNVKETGKKATIITESTIIAGNISTEDDLIIEGSVCGDVDCKGELTISGEVAGNAIAASINIKTSKFDGDVRSDGKIDINEGTVVIGNIYGESATIAGAVKGEIIVSNDARLEPTAIVKGNIRAKSVQIEHGAVLQGFCELAYENLDLEDFFGDKEVVDEDEVKETDYQVEETEIVEEKVNDEVVENNMYNVVENNTYNVIENNEPIMEETSEEIEEIEEKEEIEEINPIEEIDVSALNQQQTINEIEEVELLDNVFEDELNETQELELLSEDENKQEFIQEMENNYSNFMDQLKMDE